MDHNDEQTQSPLPSSPNGSGYMKLAGVEDGQYDALADLFLGDSELAPEPLSNTGTDAIDPAPLPAPTLPAPSIHIMPRLADQEHQRNTQEQVTPFAASVTGTIPCIEAVLLGHLPVRASLWVRQYACSTARRRNEVIALIRATAGSTSVDLISGNQPIESAQCDSLCQALASVNTIADRIILRVDETTEPELLDRNEIDEITILTGADEAAVVASYRLIKTLTSFWDTDNQASTPHLRLAVMGATGQQAADASTKLSRAVDAFLDRPIEIIDVAGRIDATVTTNIFRDAMAHQATQILDELIDIGCGIPSLTQPDPFLQEPIHQEPIHQEPIHQEPIHQEPTSQKPVAISPRPTQTEPPQIKTAQELPIHQPTLQPAPQKLPASTHPTLCQLIQGLTKLETTCPFALEVELCVDSAGSLHLVTDEQHEGPMVRLETVRAWVRDHLPLILRAEPALAFPSSKDRSAEIDLHLITHDPQSVRGLIDSPVHIYVMAEIEVADQLARVATRIN